MGLNGSDVSQLGTGQWWWHSSDQVWQASLTVLSGSEDILQNRHSTPRITLLHLQINMKHYFALICMPYQGYTIVCPMGYAQRSDFASL